MAFVVSVCKGPSLPMLETKYCFTGNQAVNIQYYRPSDRVRKKTENCGHFRQYYAEESDDYAEKTSDYAEISKI